MATLGDNIKRLRGTRSMDIVARLGDFDQSFWSRLEAGEGNPTLRIIDRVIKALDVSLAELSVDEKGNSVSLAGYAHLPPK